MILIINPFPHFIPACFVHYVFNYNIIYRKYSHGKTFRKLV